MKTVLAILTVLVVLSVGAIPHIVYASTPTVGHTTPVGGVYVETVKASGTIEMSNSYSIYLPQAVMADEVLVSVGDYVTADQLLATIMVDPLEGGGGDPLKPPAENGGLGELTPAVENILPYAEILEMYGISSDILAAALNPSTVGESQAVISQGREVTSPISGIITEMNMRAGSLTSTAKPVITIGDNSSYIALIDVKEADIAKIALGDKVSITGSGMGGQGYTGYVSRIYPTAKKVVSGTTTATVVQVEVTITNPDGRLKPGFTAQAVFQISQPKDIQVIPYEAILQDYQNVEYVYVYEDGVVTRENIITGVELTNGVEVTAGLGPDDIIILNPGTALQSGARVILQAAP